MHIDEALQQVPLADELLTARSAMQAQVWIVGGTVRDLLLGRTPVDVDIATPHPEPLARRFAGLTEGTLVPMDPERGIWRVALDEGLYFDFCGFRDHDILGDLRGRDFTINAIALRLPEPGHSGGLMDPFHGIDDLNAGLLRLVSRRALHDDPARILRAFRFLAELRLSITDETRDAIIAGAENLPLVAAERLLAEWWKLCAGPYAAAAIQQMDEAGVLTVLFPELQEAKGVTQNVYHHLDVWNHLLLTVTYLNRFLHHPEEVFQDLLAEFTPLLQDTHRRGRLVFLGLLHDVGKPATRSEEDGRVHFYRHEVVGAELAEAIGHRLRMSREDITAISRVIQHHMRPLFLLQARARGELSRKAMARFFDDTGPLALEVMALALADKSAGQGPAAEPDVQDRLRELYRELLLFYQTVYQPANAHPLLTGRDLTQELRLPPGPRVGQLLRRAREMQLQGKLTSREDALAWATRSSRHS